MDFDFSQYPIWIQAIVYIAFPLLAAKGTWSWFGEIWQNRQQNNHEIVTRQLDQTDARIEAESLNNLGALDLASKLTDKFDTLSEELRKNTEAIYKSNEADNENNAKTRDTLERLTVLMERLASIVKDLSSRVASNEKNMDDIFVNFRSKHERFDKLEHLINQLVVKLVENEDTFNG